MRDAPALVARRPPEGGAGCVGTRWGRPLNAVWTAAGDYGVLPRGLFACDEAGHGGLGPDAALYANLATGLVHKWFDADAIARFAAAWEGDFRAEQLDRTLWLAFEEAAYTCERDDRPALEPLRESLLACLSPDELELAGQLQAEGPQTGAPGPEATERAERLAATERVIDRVRPVILSRYGFDGHVVRPPGKGLHLGVALLGLALRDRLGRTGPRRFALAVGRARKAAGDDGEAGPRHDRREGERLTGRERRDRDYVRNCFGSQLLPPRAVRELEADVCRGLHATCRLWFADGSAGTGGGGGRAFARMFEQFQEQRLRNRRHYEENRRTYDALADRLAAMLLDRMEGDERVRERRRRSGSLDGASAWRATLLGDGRVFERRPHAERPDAVVTVLVDASGSRSDEQLEVAAQARILAAALARCGIATLVASYCSVRGYTVLRRLFGSFLPGARGETAAAGLDGIFGYCAGGMNRDGLAIRAAGRLLAQDPRPRRLLLVLTDAAPLDVHKPACTDEVAVDDAADAVREVRAAGVAVAAVYTGSDALVRNARRIYGGAFARIRRTERMADAAAALMADALSAM